MGLPNRKVVFQPSIFTGYVRFKESKPNLESDVFVVKFHFVFCSSSIDPLFHVSFERRGPQTTTVSHRVLPCIRGAAGVSQKTVSGPPKRSLYIDGVMGPYINCLIIIFTGWWFQPIWKICSSNWIISPRIGVKIKNIWNHHLLVVYK